MIALVSLSEQGARLARQLHAALPGAGLFIHETVAAIDFAQARRFSRVVDLVAELFGSVSAMVFIAPCGVAVRAVAPHVRSKMTDPAVVVVDVGGRHAVSLLGGHEAGANDLAIQVGNILGAEPVITTTSEAVKNIIVGIGCRAGAATADILAAVRAAVALARAGMEEVRYLASADIKKNEAGLIEAARELGIPLRFIASEEIRACTRDFGLSRFVMEKVNLPAVAEPAALLAGRRTSLLLPKTIHNQVTVAVARENSLSSGSAPVAGGIAPAGRKRP